MSKEVRFCHLFNVHGNIKGENAATMYDYMEVWIRIYSTVGRGSFSALEFKHTQRRGESTLCVSAFSIKVVTNEGMSHSKTDG